MTVNDIMTSNPVTLSSKDSIAKAMKIIAKNDFDHIPVLDEDTRLVGIISKGDMYRKALNLSHSTTGKSFTHMVLDFTVVSQLMTHDPVTVARHQSVQAAADLLLKGTFHALPVVENEKLVGILTSKDLLKHYVSSSAPSG